MRALICALLTAALPAQVPAPAPQPQWLADLQKIQQNAHQAPLGSLDGNVEQAWRAALQAPGHTEFHMAARLAANFYASQGYDLKAEQVLREALAAVPRDDPATRRNLLAQLAGHFESTQQLVKALSIREELSTEPAALANLYERMGEFEKAEAAWKAMADRPSARTPQPHSLSHEVMGSGPFGHPAGARNELADFYARVGRTAEAEQVYAKALAAVARGGSDHEWIGAADSYIGFLAGQRRFQEAADLARQGVARLEASSDPQATRMLLSRLDRLSALLAQAGRPGEALAVQKQAVESAQARNSGGPEHVQALGSLAQTLMNQSRLEEAEKAALQMREAGAADSPNARFHESMAAQILARIRDMQGRPEEARRLRESVGVPDLAAANPPATVFDLVGPAQRAAFQGNVDAAVAAAGRAVALASERGGTNPQEVSALMSLAHVLMSRQKQAEARHIAVEALRILEQAPDHPRVADALGSVVSGLAHLELAGEAERAIERQEKILLGAKGAGSLALNSIGHGRIQLMQRDSNWRGVVEERRRILARTAQATGDRSRESLYALREVAWAYPSLDDWREEEQLLHTLLGRTVSLAGESSVDYAHLLQHMANRASRNGEFEKALAWIDRAMEIARTLPDAGVHLPAIVQNRAQIVQMKSAPAGGPFFGPSGAPANQGGRWFDAGSYRKTDGARPGSRPARAVKE